MLLSWWYNLSFHVFTQKLHNCILIVELFSTTYFIYQRMYIKLRYAFYCSSLSDIQYGLPNDEILKWIIPTWNNLNTYRGSVNFTIWNTFGCQKLKAKVFDKTFNINCLQWNVCRMVLSAVSKAKFCIADFSCASSYIDRTRLVEHFYSHISGIQHIPPTCWWRL